VKTKEVRLNEIMWCEVHSDKQQTKDQGVLHPRWKTRVGMGEEKGKMGQETVKRGKSVNRNYINDRRCTARQQRSLPEGDAILIRQSVR
jgi:hypothetical protein